MEIRLWQVDGRPAAEMGAGSFVSAFVQIAPHYMPAGEFRRREKLPQKWKWYLKRKIPAPGMNLVGNLKELTVIFPRKITTVIAAGANGKVHRSGRIEFKVQVLRRSRRIGRQKKFHAAVGMHMPKTFCQYP